MISKYKKFINEQKEESLIDMILESRIVFTQPFLDLLSKIESPISQRLSSLVGKDIDTNTNYIEYDINNIDKVLFTPDSKAKTIKTQVRNLLPSLVFGDKSLPDYCELSYGSLDKVEEVEFIDDDKVLIKWTDYWGTKKSNIVSNKVLYKDVSSIRKSDINVGKFTRALLLKTGFEVTQKELEDFVTKYKANILIEKEKFTKFDIVSGDDIKKWYLHNNYERIEGTLGNSCMRYDSCQSYFRIYTENPNQVSLIILKSDDGLSIKARALLWTDDKDRKIVDRVYTNNHSDEYLFKLFAIDKGFLYKSTENSDYLVDGYKMLDDEESKITVILEESYDNEDKFPYMDTLMYIEFPSTISNDDNSSYDDELCRTSGVLICPLCRGEGTFECGECSGSGEETCSNCRRGEVDCTNCHSGKVDCYDCEGSGLDDDNECNTCDGSGEVSCDECDGSGEVSCDECGGSGDVSCEECGGDCNIDCECDF